MTSTPRIYCIGRLLLLLHLRRRFKLILVMGGDGTYWPADGCVGENARADGHEKIIVTAAAHNIMDGSMVGQMA